jgi:hypothetical protein
MRQLLFKVVAALVSGLALQLPVQAADMPEVSSVLKKMLGALPVPGIKDELQKMAATLKNTSCGGGLKGCYSAKSGQLQLYFFTTGQAQQTLLLVIDRKLSAPMPMLLGEKLHKIMTNTELQSPIISISTTEYQLDTSMMPPDLQKVVRESYFNVDSLLFSSGVQLAARADLGSPIKELMATFVGLKGSQTVMRAGVAIPIPTDLTSGAGAGVGVASAVLKEGDTMKKASADAMKPDAFIELQFAPNTQLTLGMPKVILSDATFFITQSLTFGYKGNVTFKGMTTKKNVLLQFNTPLTPMGAMDLLDFSFRMATPADYNMQDAAQLMYAMAAEDHRLMKYGGGFIRNIDLFKKPLSEVGNILAMFQLSNPNPTPQYRFGDSTKPWPDDPKYFNILLAGPMATDGPLMKAAGNVNILGQEMGWLEASAGLSGMHAAAGRALTLPLGPLGKVSFKMEAKADIDKDSQNISLHGDFAGQPIDVILAGTTLTLKVGASCVNPFEIKAKLALTPTTNLADVFAGQAGANVDPSKLQNCIGKELEAAYNKIAGEYKALSGYTAGEANAALKKIADGALQAAAETVKVAEKAAADAKDAADKATAAANAANAKIDDAQKRADAMVEAASKFNTADVKNWGSAGVNRAGDAITGGLKKVGSAVNKATCRLAGNCKRKKKDSEVCIGVYDEEFVIRSHPEMSPEAAYNWFVVGKDAACKAFQTQRGSAEFQSEEYRAINAARYDIPHNNLYFPEELTKHWVEIGRKDGAQGSYAFNIRDYRAANPDIDQMNWPSWLDYWGHWLNAGINEGRSINAEFAATEYLANYADLRELLGETNYPAAFDHWVIKGKAEGRKGRIDHAARAQAAADAQAVNDDAKAAAAKATEDARVAGEKAKKLKDQAAWQSIDVFSAPAYYELNKARYGFTNPSDYAGLTKHWLEVGMKDAVRGNSVFDIQEYSRLNPDLWANVTPARTWEAMWRHWFDSGIYEGRAFSREFEVTEYLALYPDLQRAFGATNYKAAYHHWVEFGKVQGRQGRR